MRYDYKTLYEKNAAFFNAAPLRKRLLYYADFILTFCFLLAYTALLSHAVQSKMPATEFVAILFAPMLAFVLATVLQLAIERYRPYSPQGAAIDPIYKKSGSDNKSFPSRHLTCAFAIATACLPHIPVLAASLYLFGILLGYVRFSIGWHYPSDLFGGAAIGAGIGCLIFFI
jgi:membrane-associated phospholipid phosphatase